MKKWLGVLLIVSIAGTVFAEKREHHRGSEGGVIAEEIEAFIAQERDTAIGDLTFGEIEDLMLRISVPMQEDAYVSRSAGASMMIPGMGQFKNGEPLIGALFLTTDVLLTAGTLVGTYLLLPSELKFGNLDYLNEPVSDIKETWEAAIESMSLAEALPLMAVTAGGMFLHGGLRAIAGRNAAKLARRNIEDGTVTFEPRLFLTSHGRMGMGFSMMR